MKTYYAYNGEAFHFHDDQEVVYDSDVSVPRATGRRGPEFTRQEHRGHLCCCCDADKGSDE